MKPFYYSPTQSSINYSRTPTGSLGIQELIAGKPCWIPATLPRIEKQKTLILADWTAKTWTPNKLKQVVKSLGELMDQGFSVYIWRDGHVSPMTQRGLSTLLNKQEIQEGITMASTGTISDVAVKENKLALDQIQVIDDYWLNYILSHQGEPEARVLYTSDLSNLTPKEMENLINILQEARPKLETIIHNTFSQESNDKVKLLKSKLNDVKIFFKYTIVELNDSDINPLIDIIDKKNTSSSNHYRLLAEQFSSIESLDVLNSNISSANLKKLLAASPNLHLLTLSYCVNLDGELNLDDINLEHLEFIDASHSNISSDNLVKLIRTAPNISLLGLIKCTILDRELNLDGVNLLHLESIDVSNSNISAVNLKKLLTTAPNIRSLNLYGCQSLNSELNLDGIKLDQLESIVLSSSNISAANLKKLLTTAPNIRSLDLCGCQSLGSELNLDEIKLDQLKSIGVSHSNISPDNLKKILTTAPNIRSLNLYGCQRLDGELNFDGISLEQLKSIDVSHSNISHDNLQKLLAAAPNAKLKTHPSFSTPLTNPTHDSKKLKEIKPKSQNEPFQFKGTNQTKNQGMIIEKLSQYLTQKGKHLDIIPKIQDGICRPLSHYFLTIGHKKWNEFITLSLAWNGQEEIPDALSRHFDALYENIKTYQLDPLPKVQYLGDELQSYLDTDSTSSFILTNPWHAIAVQPVTNERWHVYDPNYVTGYQTVSRKDLLRTFRSAIGTIVSIEADTVNHTLKIDDPNAFMEHGGLLALCRCDNAKAMLSKLPQDHVYSEAALEGLLLRNTSGKPAWSIGIANHNPDIRALAIRLHAQFEAMHGASAPEKLIKSIDTLTAMQQGEAITQLVRAASSKSDEQVDVEPDTRFIDAIRASANKQAYGKALKTWDKTAEYAATPLSYCHTCLQKTHAKRLIELNSSEHVHTLRLQLEQQAINTHRPVFYIDKPDDLICSAPWMKKNADGRGELCRGPGGALYDFLQENQDQAPLVIVNYEQFNADDIVRFNGLLDKDPHADGTPLPENTMILGLMNRNKPDCYQGSDFYSRFNQTEHCPLTHEQLDALTSQRTVEVATPKDGTSTIIHLYHAPDWEERLLGRWVLDGDTLNFHEGELIKAIQAGKPIKIQHGLWGDKAFERFWQQALSGGVRHAGRIVKIPESIQIIRPKTEAYTWDTIPTIHDDLLEPDARVLNPTNLGRFFDRYELEGDTLNKAKGWIEEHQSLHTPCVINVTRTLTDDAWAMLLDECAQRDVQLSLHVAPGVKLPSAFNYQPQKAEVTRNISFPVTGDGLIVSTDIDTTVSMLTNTPNQTYEVIDVSECTSADLLVRLDGKLNEETLRFEFSQFNGALITGLERHKHIILKGHFSSELLDNLAPVLLERQKTPQASQLLLVTQDETAANDMPSASYTHTVRNEDKLFFLELNEANEQHERIKNELTLYLAKEPLSKLKARCAYLKSHSTAESSDNAWLGMMSLSSHTHNQRSALDRAQSKEQSEAFTRARIHEVHEVLASSPYVFLTGLSGVGKSTFVEKELSQHDDNIVYLTENSTQTWAEDTSEHQKILFLDEANLSTRQWSEFEGLFNQPPSLLINGTLYPLDDNHKVVFAGNPVNYGDERTLAPFFQRHGNAVLFTPLPPAVIYEYILKPVFLDSDIDFEPVVDRILDVYHFVCACSTTDILISPRELQMMALLIQTRHITSPEQDINAIAEHFIYALAKNLVPQKNRPNFEAQFQPKNPITSEPNTIEELGQFFITPSRQALSQQINDFMSLREWRCTSDNPINPQQKSGGLGGIVIEGEPGIGKSELVITELRKRGYQEAHDFITPSTAKNLFYRMPVSMSLNDKEALLLKAFHEGAVVIIDEINSSPMMERLLNDLLMGKNPRPIEGMVAKPGFMVIGTQNPVTMAGRRIASTALQRRLMTTELPEYSPEEIKTILLAKGLANQEADAMVEAYTRNRTYAIKHNLSPVPNFRDLIYLADNHLQSLRPALLSAVSEASTLSISEQNEPLDEPRIGQLKKMILHTYSDENLHEELKKDEHVSKSKDSLRILTQRMKTTLQSERNTEDDADQNRTGPTGAKT